MSDNKTTEIIERIADAVHKKPSGEIPLPHPWKCEQGHRLDSMETLVADHEARIRSNEKSLSEGDSRFTRLEGKLESVSEKLGELADTIKSAIRWLLGIAGTAAAGGVLWAMAHAGKAVP